jgi:peroxiredoxin
MKWPGEGDIPNCLLFAALVLAAVVITCLGASWALYTGDGVWALSADGSTDEPPAPSDSPQTVRAMHDAAPGFTLPDLNGDQISLSDFSGRPVVVNFWATWCPPCRSEVPHLIEAYERDGGEVVFLAISVDEPASTVRRFARENDMPFIILLDDGGKVASDYRINSIPVTFFISRDGEIVARYVGQMPPHRIEEGLSRIR